MAKAQQYNTSVTAPGVGGLHQDTDPVNQPKGTYRFALNAVNEGEDGQQQSLSNEKASVVCDNKPEGFEFIGDRYLEDDTTAVILVNPTTGEEIIGLINKDNLLTKVVETNILGLSITHQCDIIYRLRRGDEKVIYWVDGNNVARTFNYTRPYNFYNRTYQAYLRAGGNPNTYLGEKWDASSFDLLKSYTSIPNFSNIEIIESGSIVPGSYNFAIQYIDEDLNPTEWITTSNTVNIFNDSIANPFHKIRGSRNTDNSSQSFPRANKSIKLTLSNLDDSFPFYRVAIIRAANNTGDVDKVFASDLFSTADSNFLYSGNDGNLTEVDLGDILIEKEVIFAPQHIEQLENRLILANTKGKGINWCEFQQYASKIGTHCIFKQVLLNTVLSEPNVKNAKSTFFFRGYMPGEVYSLGIVYVMSDGTISPTFHIPGKSNNDTTGSNMKVYELSSRYLDIHNCSTNNYWGRDINGETLVGKLVRHHRFPFRHEVNKNLTQSSSSFTQTITKKRLRVTVTLNPSYTVVVPNEYPTDINGDPILIPFVIQYQINGIAGVSEFESILTDSNIGNPITVYDDVTDLDIISGPDYGMLDPTSDLATTYQGGGDPRFILTFLYDTHDATSTGTVDTSDIFGIEFDNIEKPHPDVIGFYIVRNERMDEDRLIVDTAILGPSIENQQYRSFGLIMPKQFYAINGSPQLCPGFTRPVTPPADLVYSERNFWFFNPEFQYLGKKFEPTEIEIEGAYVEQSITLPECETGRFKGVYIDDVQAGTSYNPDIHKSKDSDDDGFDLMIGYRNTEVAFFFTLPGGITALPDKERVFYLNAATYQNYGSNTYYNVSCDNKIGMWIVDADLDTEIFYSTSTKKNHLIYGAMVRESDSLYSNFLTRSYYKEHNNPVMFNTNTVVNNVQVYNGDTHISAFNFVSTVFNDMLVASRDKKSKVWQIVVGAILVVAAIVVTIVTAGAGAPLAVSAVAGSLSALAISYGVSLAMSGIKFEQFKSMIDVDYSKGLKDTVTDGAVLETIRGSVGRGDDTIRWFADRVSRIYMESSISFGLRSGLTCGVTDFIDAPAPYDDEEFRSYLTEKLTALDRDRGSGRMYKGYATAEIYDMNLDYLRFNKQKIFPHLPIEFDCCTDSKEEKFPTRVWYSQQSFQEENIDNYRAILPNNYRDIEGEHGEITDLYRLGNSLFIHTKEALWHLPQNIQERVTNEIVSLIGTGEFFGTPPRKVVDDNLGSGGTQHKWGTVKTRNGVMFINETENKIYLHSDKLKDVSADGLRNWFENYMKSYLVKQIYDKLGITYANGNNPANSNGVGYLSTYDTRYNRVIFTKRDYLILPAKLNTLLAVAEVPTAGTAFVYCIADGNFYEGITKIDLDNEDFFENRSWTISYSFHTRKWVSWHSYLPNYYIHSQNNLLSSIVGDVGIYKHNQEGRYQVFYEQLYPFIVEYVKTNILQDSIIEDLTLHTRARKFDATVRQFVDQRFITFNKIVLSNSYQCSGELIMITKDTQANPELWFRQQITNAPGSILITRKERNWNINDFRDYIVDYESPMFSTAWNNIKDNYFIDKVVNPGIISFAKPWHELQNFRDKYIVIRLKFDTFDNINLILNYSLETEQISHR